MTLWKVYLYEKEKEQMIVGLLLKETVSSYVYAKWNWFPT